MVSSAHEVISSYVGALVARSILDNFSEHTGMRLDDVQSGDVGQALDDLRGRIRFFVPESGRLEQCMGQLEQTLKNQDTPAKVRMDDAGPQVITIDGEYDIVTVRGETRKACERLGFPALTQIKVATVASELARNIIQYAGGGRFEIRTLTVGRQGVELVAKDDGPGIENLDHVLSGDYVSKTGMGKGLVGTRNLVDEFDVTSAPGKGTVVVARKYLQ